MSETTDQPGGEASFSSAFAAPNSSAPGAGVLITPNSNETLAAKTVQVEPRPKGMDLLSEEIATHTAKVLETCTPLTRSILTITMAYLEEMGQFANLAPGEGMRKQKSLYRELINYLNNAPDDYRRGFGGVLRIINDQKSGSNAFSPRMLFRFVPEMDLNNTDRLNLEMFFQALVILCEPSGRASALKQVDLGRLASLTLAESGRSKLISFFAI